MLEQGLLLLLYCCLELVCMAIFLLDSLLLQRSLRLKKELPILLIDTTALA